MAAFGPTWHLHCLPRLLEACRLELIFNYHEISTEWVISSLRPDAYLSQVHSTAEFLLAVQLIRVWGNGVKRIQPQIKHCSSTAYWFLVTQLHIKSRCKFCVRPFHQLVVRCACVTSCKHCRPDVVDGWLIKDFVATLDGFKGPFSIETSVCNRVRRQQAATYTDEIEKIMTVRPGRLQPQFTTIFNPPKMGICHEVIWDCTKRIPYSSPFHQLLWASFCIITKIYVTWLVYQ